MSNETHATFLAALRTAEQMYLKAVKAEFERGLWNGPAMDDRPFYGPRRPSWESDDGAEYLKWTSGER